MLGPSGSGKTTVLRMIAGFESPTAGRIELAGRDVTDDPPFDRDVNTVFQDYALFPHMTVVQNVAYGLMVKKVGKSAAADPRARGAGHGAARGLRVASAQPALRRPAAARRPGPRPGQRAQGPAARRAARRARPQAARADAGRAQVDPARRRHHVPVRDPRPGGGPDDERPRRGVQQRPHRAGRLTARRLRATRHGLSSPASSARRTCSRVRRRASSWARTASSPCAPRRSGSRPVHRRTTTSRATARSAHRVGCARWCTPARPPATSYASTPAASSSRSGRTMTPHQLERRRVRAAGRRRAPGLAQGACLRGWRKRMSRTRLFAIIAAAALALSACGGSSGSATKVRQHGQQGGGERLHAAEADGPREARHAGRAR